MIFIILPLYGPYFCAWDAKGTERERGREGGRRRWGEKERERERERERKGGKRERGRGGEIEGGIGTKFAQK